MIEGEVGCIPSFWFSFGINMPSRRGGFRNVLCGILSGLTANFGYTMVFYVYF